MECEQILAQFREKYGKFGETILRVFNEYDHLDLQPGECAPEDEYLTYIERFLEQISLVPKDRRTEVCIGITLFKSFSPEDLLGVCTAFSNSELENDENHGTSVWGGHPRITVEDIICLAQKIFAEIRKSKINLVLGS